VDPLSVRIRLTLILGVVLLPLLLGTTLVLAVVVPDQLHEQSSARLRAVAGAVASLQIQSCVGAGDSAELMALAVAKGEPAAAALRRGLERRPGYGSIMRDRTVLVRSPSLPSGAVVDVVPTKGCSTPIQPPARVVAAPTTSLPFLTDTVSVAGLGPVQSVTAVVATPLDGSRLRGWLQDIGVGADVDLAVACPEGTTASTASGPRNARLRAFALSRLGGGREDLPGSSLEVAAVGAGHPCLVIATAPLSEGVAAPWLLFALLGLVLALGAPMVWWLARQLTMPVVAVTLAAERAALGDLSVRLPVVRTDEVGRLAQSFNHMAGELEQQLTEIKHSRDLLADNVQRLGDALQRTHDLDGLLATVCALSASTTESVRATAWLVEGSSLVARVAWPPESLRSSAGRVPMEGTLLGRVVSTGLPAWTDAAEQSAVSATVSPLTDAHDKSALLGGPALAAPLQRGNDTLGAIVVERTPGSPAYSRESGATLASITGPAGIAMDNALLHRKAQRLSVFDPLTGVGNLRMLTTTLTAEVERARHFNRCCSLMILDIDHFRDINRLYGHAAGDQVLAGVAARIAASVRSVDRVARYGGEEFAVVCPELDPTAAVAAAEKLWHAFRAQPFEVDGGSVVVRVSIGVASWPQQAGTSTALLRAADSAVVHAKGLGRDQVVLSERLSG
jgi:two-component system cell cycle response regulator